MTNKSLHTLCSFIFVLLFMVCSFFVLLFQIHGYEAMNDKNEDVYNTHTPISYIASKVKQAENVLVDDNELVLYMDGKEVHIYEEDGNLYEASALKNIDAHGIGDCLLPCENVKFKLQDQMLSFSFTYEEETYEYIWKLREGEVYAYK